jgi:sulfur-oxidizing protein SoxY
VPKTNDTSQPVPNPPGQLQLAESALARRTVLAGALALTLIPVDRSFAATAGERTVFFIETYKKLVGDKVPEQRDVKVEILETAENGNTVPFTISVISPMTPEAHVRKITLLSTGNPQALVATFYFTPRSGRASVSGRLRLACSQEVIAIAELNTGELIRGQTKVNVLLDSCGS